MALQSDLLQSQMRLLCLFHCHLLANKMPCVRTCFRTPRKQLCYVSIILNAFAHPGVEAKAQKHGDINYTFFSSYLTHIMACPGIKQPGFGFCRFCCSVFCGPSLRELIIRSVQKQSVWKKQLF